jgi:ankyrin repeat protein
LQKAIREEEFDCAYRLIEEGACINDTASKGEGGRTALQAAVSVGDVDMIEHLLFRGADVNAPAAVANGVTALQSSCH